MILLLRLDKPQALNKVDEFNTKQLDQREMQTIFETKCDSDFKLMREFFRFPIYIHTLTPCATYRLSLSLSLYFSAIPQWKDAVRMLELSDGAAWRLIFKLLSRGRLYDEGRQRPLKITGRGLVKEYQDLFSDTYA